MMKIIMFIILIIGLAIFSLGLYVYIEGVLSREAGGVIGGIIFGVTIMPIGGVILLIDGIIYLIYRSRKKKIASS